ncbi:MAG TPA: hypothetical protein VFM46_07800, partial [Pseudomonadales bacterium]|nr:hypothetical protein [Pseudomonadales bacterium]
MSSVADLTEQAMAPWEKSQPYYHGSVYYRARSLLLLAPTLNIADNDKTLQRPAIRLLLAHRAPFHLVLNDGRAITARAVMLSPKVGRFTLNATQCDVALFDFLPASPEYV